MRRPLVMTVLVSAALLPGCGDGDDTDVVASTTTTIEQGSSSTTEPGGTTSSAPPFDGSTEPVDVPAAQAGTALLSDVEVGHHEGFDRVVFEFRGLVPGYHVAYVDPPITEDGSGRDVEVAGESFVEVRMSPASAYDLEANQSVYEGPQRIDARDVGTDVVAEVVKTGDFEAILTWVIGARERAPYRVFTLQDPPRLVVDVQIRD